MIIQEQELFDYIYCPLKYKVTTNNIKTNITTYNSLLHDVYNHMCMLICNDSTTSLKIIKNKWDSICKNNQAIINSKQVVEGWGLLMRAYEYINNNNIKFIDTFVSYRIDLLSSKYILTGQIESIIDRKDMFILLQPSFAKTSPEQYKVNSDLKTTIHCYAIQEMFKKDVCVINHSFRYNTDLFSIRNETHYKRLKHILDNVGTSIEQNLIYPRENFACNQCAVKELCDEWSGD